MHSDECVFGGWRRVYAPTFRSTSLATVDETTLEARRNEIRAIIDKHTKNSQPSIHKKVTDAVKEMGQNCGMLTGKWMVFERDRVSCDSTNTCKMDKQWTKVKQAVLSNELGFSAKITDGKAGGRVMCIYTYSFLDEVDVWRVLQQLHRISVCPISWKADIVTHLGLYSDDGSMKSGGRLYLPGLRMGWFTKGGLDTFKKSQEMHGNYTQFHRWLTFSLFINLQGSWQETATNALIRNRRQIWVRAHTVVRLTHYNNTVHGLPIHHLSIFRTHGKRRQRQRRTQ
jgi:hypothetical protein